MTISSPPRQVVNSQAVPSQTSVNTSHSVPFERPANNPLEYAIPDAPSSYMISDSPGFGEVNTKTGGVEYYGPGGNYTFMRHLWRFALKHSSPTEDQTREAPGSLDSQLSVVNYFHTSAERANVADSNSERQIPTVIAQRHNYAQTYNLVSFDSYLRLHSPPCNAFNSNDHMVHNMG